MFNEFDPVYFVNHVHRVLKPSDDPVGEASIHGLSVASNVQIGTTDASLKIFRLDSTGNLTTSGSFIFKGLSGPLSNNVRVQGQLTVESGNGVLVNSISGITVTSSNSGNVFVKLLRTDANSSNFLRFIPEGSYSASHPQYWLGIDQNSYDLDLIRYDGSTELRLLKVNANGTIGILSGVTITGNLATSGTLTSRGNTELKANVSIAGNSTLTGTLSVNSATYLSTLNATGNVSLGNTEITGYAQVRDTLTVTGSVNFKDSLDVSGNVILGTGYLYLPSSPAYLYGGLTVSGTPTTIVGSDVENILLLRTSGVNYGIDITSADKKFKVFNPLGPITFELDTERFRIQHDGKVGINTPAPVSGLDVNADAIFRGNTTLSGTSYIATADNSNVGINTKNPLSLLDVNGSTSVHKPTVNYLKFSSDLSKNEWGKFGLSSITYNNVAPDSTLTAMQATATLANDAMYQAVSDYNFSGSSIVFSIWLRTISSGNNLSLYILDGSNSAESPINVTSSWNRFYVSTVATSTGPYNVFIGGNNSWSIGETLQLWGPQLELAEKPSGYIPTSDFPESGTEFFTIKDWRKLGINTTRPEESFDVNSNASLRGTTKLNNIVLDKASTNLINYSKDFSQWSYSGGAISTVSDTTPNGYSDTVNHFIGTSVVSKAGIATTPNNYYTFSIWLKSHASDFEATLKITDSNGSLSSQKCKVTSSWKRFTLSRLVTTTTVTVSASGTEMMPWGAQFESGEVATGYIATNGSTASSQSLALNDSFRRLGILTSLPASGLDVNTDSVFRSGITVSGTAYLALSGNTRVGINTTSPSSGLDVNVNSVFRSGVTISGSTYIALSDSDRVGINTTSPSSGLDVNANSVFRSGVIISGVTTFKDNINLEPGKNFNLQSTANSQEWSFDLLGQNDYIGGHFHVWTDKSGAGDAGSILAVRGDTANVGIRTTGPAYGLDVNADSIFREDALFNSNNESTDPYTGAVKVVGGLGLTGRINSYGSINTYQNLNVSGNAGFNAEAPSTGLLVNYDASFRSGVFFGESSENLLDYSEIFTTPSWTTLGNATLGSQSITKPDGTTGIVYGKLTGGLLSATNAIRKNFSGLDDSNYYTFSLWIKGNSTGSININMSINGILYTESCSYTTSWKRFSISKELPSGQTSIMVSIGGNSSLGNGEVVYLWGGQFENKDHATVYIPTNGAATSANNSLELGSPFNRVVTINDLTVRDTLNVTGNTSISSDLSVTGISYLAGSANKNLLLYTDPLYRNRNCWYYNDIDLSYESVYIANQNNATFGQEVYLRTGTYVFSLLLESDIEDPNISIYIKKSSDNSPISQIVSIPNYSSSGYFSVTGTVAVLGGKHKVEVSIGTSGGYAPLGSFQLESGTSRTSYSEGTFGPYTETNVLSSGSIISRSFIKAQSSEMLADSYLSASEPYNTKASNFGYEGSSESGFISVYSSLEFYTDRERKILNWGFTENSSLDIYPPGIYSPVKIHSGRSDDNYLKFDSSALGSPANLTHYSGGAVSWRIMPNGVRQVGATSGSIPFDFNNSIGYNLPSTSAYHVITSVDISQLSTNIRINLPLVDNGHIVSFSIIDNNIGIGNPTLNIYRPNGTDHSISIHDPSNNTKHNNGGGDFASIPRANYRVFNLLFFGNAWYSV